VTRMAAVGKEGNLGAGDLKNVAGAQVTDSVN
jgi:hypothetical protein